VQHITTDLVVINYTNG